MSIRHNKIQTTLGKGLATEWNDDHFSNFYLRIEHFYNLYLNAIADEWDLTQETSTTAATITFNNGYTGIRLSAVGGAGNFAAIRKKILNAAADITIKEHQPILNMAVEIDTPTNDNATHEFGLFTSANVPFAANQTAAFFRVDQGKLNAVTSDGAAETATEIDDVNQYGSYRIQFTSTQVKFFVDNMNTAAATHTANIPAAALTPKFTCAHRAAGTNTLDIQGVALSVLREQ